MTRRLLGCCVTLAFVLMGPLTAQAPPAGNIWRLGYLAPTPPPQPAYLWAAPLEAFWQAWRGLGYVEGHNLTVESRWADGDVARLPALAAELVQRQVDVIVTMGTPPAHAAKQATTTIPIVMSGSADPVAEGLVASLARPGGNLTGPTDMPGPDLDGKALELFKQAVPRLSQVAVLWWDSGKRGGSVAVQEQAAATLGFALLRFGAYSLADLRGAFAAITAAHADGLVVPTNPVTGQYHDRILEFATAQRLPTLYQAADRVRVGGLMSYFTDWMALDRRTALCVDKIFKGAKPADLPIEQPTTFELVIHLKTAEALGLTIPPALLFQADEVIQ